MGSSAAGPPPPSAAATATAVPMLRVFFIPFFATGHMIPLVDIARLFAKRGIDSTVLATPANAALVRRTVDDAAASGHPLHLLLYPFPSAELGLPDGCENLASVAPSESHKVLGAVALVRDPVGRLLREHRPDCVVADTHFGWATCLSRDLGIPRLSFHAIGMFPIAVMNALMKHRPHDEAAGSEEPFLVPGLPHAIEMVRPELPDFLRSPINYINDVMEELREAELGSHGVLLNSFHGLEPNYIDHQRKTHPRKLWCVGPVALTYGDNNDDASAAAARGEGGGGHQVDKDGEKNKTVGKCMRWLECMDPGSVVYVCFGSWCNLTGEQLREMALGLEASNYPFLWVVRNDGEGEWMPEGFEERVEGRGLVVRGWAPQVSILNHVAVGAFVTHCGWNSVLEGVGAGLPMITWPLVFEQFINERLVIAVLRVGVRMWDGFRSTDDDEKVVVKAEDIARTVARLMGGSGGGDVEEEEVSVVGMRRRAREYGEMARSAVKEGGSSYLDLESLIEDIRAWRAESPPAEGSPN